MHPDHGRQPLRGDQHEVRSTGGLVAVSFPLFSWLLEVQDVVGLVGGLGVNVAGGAKPKCCSTLFWCLFVL